MTFLRTWFRRHDDIVVNTGTLVGSALATSGLGFAFWLLAARLFDPHHVGLASGAVAAMLMLSTLGVLGLDALLVGEIGARQGSTAPDRTVGGLLGAGVGASFLSSALLGVVFALVVRQASPESNLGIFFAPGWPAYVLFAVGVGLTGATFVFDRATIGLLRGGIQLTRNVAFSVLKLVALPLLLLPLFAGPRLGEAIYALWALTILVSMVMVLPRLLRAVPWASLAPDWRALLRLRAAAWGNHLVNLAQHGPGLVAPVLVAALVAPAVNAAFYVAWMLIVFAQSVPAHLASVLHAVGSQGRQLLSEKLQVTLRLSALASVATAVGLALLADPLLRIFGASYAEVAAPALRILALTVMPLAVKIHYFTLARITGFTQTAAVLGFVFGAGELAAVYLGARTSSLSVMSWALLAVLVLEALVLLPTVLRFVRRA